jgi:superfamily I DNA/RNA helicase
VSEKIRSGLAEFLDLIEKYREMFEPVVGEKSALAATFGELLEDVNYWGHLVQEFRHNEKIAKWRHENITTFSDFLERWEKNPDNLEPTLTRWLNRITLNARDELDENDAGKVNLMTIHASKGLEFDVVFFPGWKKASSLTPRASKRIRNPSKKNAVCSMWPSQEPGKNSSFHPAEHGNSSRNHSLRPLSVPGRDSTGSDGKP